MSPLGVVALDFVLSMMNGFETEIRQRIIDTTAHITVYTYAGDGFVDWQSLAEKVQEVPEVVATRAEHLLQVGHRLQSGQ